MSSQPESVNIVEPLTVFLTHEHGWHVFKTHGSMFQSGFPDLYITHKEYAPKWVECKLFQGTSTSVSFTRAQRATFPIWLANNVGIWVVADYDLRGNRPALERQYSLLFKPCNCWTYLNPMMRRMLYS